MNKQSTIEKLTELDFELPVVTKPVADYVPAKHVGDLACAYGGGADS